MIFHPNVKKADGESEPLRVWHAQIYYRGKRISKSLGTMDRDEALVREAELLLWMVGKLPEQPAFLGEKGKFLRKAFPPAEAVLGERVLDEVRELVRKVDAIGRNVRLLLDDELEVTDLREG